MTEKKHEKYKALSLALGDFIQCCFEEVHQSCLNILSDAEYEVFDYMLDCLAQETEQKE